MKSVLEDPEFQDMRAIIQDFLNLSVLSIQHQNMPDSNASLLLSLNHRTSEVRTSAVNFLFQNIDKVLYVFLYLLNIISVHFALLLHQYNVYTSKSNKTYIWVSVIYQFKGTMSTFMPPEWNSGASSFLSIFLLIHT